MKGIDIYHGDSVNESEKLKAVPEQAYKESDFVIVKATQGTSYKYTPFFYKMVKRVQKDGKLLGVYHYAAGHDAVKEADYFLSVVKDYVGQAVLCLDWEGDDNKAFGSKTWCTTFINRIKERTGVTCFLYTGMDGCKQNASLAGKVPLWYAAYPKPMRTDWTVPNFKYDLGVWKKCQIWQYTSTNEKVDRNTTELTSMEWREYANPGSAEKLIQYLEQYHTYIKSNSNHFINKYDKNMTCIAKAKKTVENGGEVGITCVVPTRWALYEMGITGRGGKALISAPNGSFKAYYVGKVKDYFDRITKGEPVGLTVAEAAQKKLIQKGDILAFENLTHIAVFSGDGCIMYEGGGGCVKDGHYPNGIKKDYKDIYKDRHISEVLRWKTKGKKKEEDKDKGQVVPPAVKRTADILLTQARAWLGCKESDGSHKKIIDLYNRYKPLPRGYKVKYSDSWCATFVSAVAIASGMADLIPPECSCQQMIELMKKKGIWVENENRTPKPGDIIFYDWQDSGAGDNKGTADHVGIVEKVDGNKITVIEGNYNDSVKRREIAVNGRYIRGYGVPKYDQSGGGGGGSDKKSLPKGKSKTTFTISKKTAPSTTEYCKAKVTANTLNVRTWAGVQSKLWSRGPLKKGTQVSVCDAILSSQGDGTTWYYIKVDGHYGFVSGKFLQ